MRTLIDFAMREEYSRVKALGDDLSDINSLINWDRFRFLEPLIYKNKTSRGGRPNIDIVIMVKALEGFDLAPIRRALNSCVNIFNLYGCF